MSQSTLSADPYWSRTGESWEIAERVDPVIWSDQPDYGEHPELESFAEKGFRADRELFSLSEAEQLLAEAKNLANEADPDDPEVIVEPSSQIVRSVFRVHHRSELMRSVCKDPRIVNFVREVLGSEVAIQQSRINYKPGFNGKEFFWHSDFETWHIEDGMPRMRAVSVSISLTENSEFNGPLMVVPGSHHWYVRCGGRTPENHYQESLRKQEYGVPNKEALETLVAKGGIEAPKGPPGSTLFFECNLMHGSTGNLSPYPRTNLFVVYNSVENELVEPFGDQPPRPEFLAEREVIPVSEL